MPLISSCPIRTRVLSLSLTALPVPNALYLRNFSFVANKSIESLVLRQVRHKSEMHAEENKFKIYTKTGDKGTSSLYTGERKPKDNDIFEALGTVDELSSTLGLAREYVREAFDKYESLNGTGDNDNDLIQVAQHLVRLQCTLQDLNSNLATPLPKESSGSSTGTGKPLSMMERRKREKTAFDVDGSMVKDLERWIDSLDSFLPPLKNFILPSGGKAASTLHLSRTICRRAERRVVPLVRADACDTACGIFLNRLSDYLFVCARYMACIVDGRPETIYSSSRSFSEKI